MKGKATLKKILEENFELDLKQEFPRMFEELFYSFLQKKFIEKLIFTSKKGSQMIILKYRRKRSYK